MEGESKIKPTSQDADASLHPHSTSVSANSRPPALTDDELRVCTRHGSRAMCFLLTVAVVWGCTFAAFEVPLCARSRVLDGSGRDRQFASILPD